MFEICRGCGEKLPPKKRPQGRGKEWCTQQCRVRHWRLAQGAWVRGETRACEFCGAEYEPTQDRQRTCSYQCGYRLRSRRRPKSLDWAAGRRPERPIPCMDCGREILSRANRQSCPECKAKRNVTTNRRKAAKRKGAAVGIRYTMAELGDRDGWKCHLCQKPVDRTLPGTDRRGPTVDHLIPLADGGGDSLENVALAHRACNVRRRDKGIVQLRLTG